MARYLVQTRETTFIKGYGFCLFLNVWLKILVKI